MESYILDPHTAVGIAVALQSMTEAGGEPPITHTVALATAHPAKFAGAVRLALQDVEGFDFDTQVLPREFVGLEERERRVRFVGKGEGVAGMRRIIREKVEGEKVRV